jgi:hypothetical protein
VRQALYFDLLNLLFAHACLHRYHAGAQFIFLFACFPV